MNFDVPERSIAAPHKLCLEDRRQLSLTGITQVESFDETVIILQTGGDTLIIRGEGLHLRALDNGQVRVDGTVSAIAYEAARTAGGFWARLFG